MKKIAKLLLVSIIVFSTLIVTGCNKKEEEQKPETVATKLVSEFKNIVKEEKDIETLATKISESETIKIAVAIMPIENEGFIEGFEDDIKGFKNAYAIKPMIGSQPFVAYIFNTDNASELSNTLKEKANKRWNICTEADELEITSVDNYVFVVMSPTSFED